jgi:hypothetical protein
VDIVTQILNFGLAAPIDIQIVGPNLYANRALAERMLNEVRYVPGAADARIQQPFNDPNLTVNVDRTRAAATGLTQQNVAQSLLVALSGSFQTSPSFYLDPRNGVSYNIAIQAPQYRMNSMAQLESLPVTGTAAGRAPETAPSTAAPGSEATAAPGTETTAAPGAPAPEQNTRQSGYGRTRRGAGRDQSLQRAAGHRYLFQRGRNRPGQRYARHGKDCGSP